MAQKIIIRIPNWLGDAVMASPAVWDLATQHPEAEITLLGLPLTVSVFQHSPFSNIKLLVYDREGIHKNFLGMMSIASRLQQQTYDLGYLLTHSVSSAFLFQQGGIERRIGYRKGWNRLLLRGSKPQPQQAQHQSQRYYYLIHNTVPERLTAKIYLSKDEIKQANHFLALQSIAKEKPIIGMAVGASFGSAKCWLPERYAEVGKRCMDEFGAHILLFGSPKELPAIQQVQQHIGSRCTVLAGHVSLRESFALASLCQMMVCNDSGMMHAATAVGTKVIAIIGPTNPIDTAPMGEGHILINKRVECAPCLKRECPLGHHQCMTSVEAEDVMNVLQVWLKT